MAGEKVRSGRRYEAGAPGGTPASWNWIWAARGFGDAERLGGGPDDVEFRILSTADVRPAVDIVEHQLALVRCEGQTVPPARPGAYAAMGITIREYRGDDAAARRPFSER